jgi:hypothetical protein
MSSPGFLEDFSVDCYCYDDFLAFLKLAPWFLESETTPQWVQSVLDQGFEEPVTHRFYGPSEIKNETDNFREGLVAGELNSRQRAMLQCVKTLNPCHQGLSATNIYGFEQVTAFANRIKAVSPSFIGSEYLPDIDARRANPHLRHEDALNLSFLNDSFDVVFSNDVIEHVPDVDRALAEVYRVLRPRGVFVSTFPFCYGEYSSVKKASLIDNEIVFHSEPEYHGNPVDPKGSLVFEIPGWEILDRAKQIGYRRSFVRITASKRYGFIGTEVPAVFVIVFEK